MCDDLEREVSERTNVSPSVVSHVLAACFDIIVEKVAAGDSVSRRNFGTFQAQDRAAKQGTHPKTGKPIVVSARRQVKFRPYVKLKRAVNEPSMSTGA